MSIVKKIIKDSFHSNLVVLVLSIVSGIFRSLLMLMPTYFTSLSLNKLSVEKSTKGFYLSVFLILFCQVLVMILYVLDTHINKYIFEISYKIKTSLFDTIFSVKGISKKIKKPEQIITNGLNSSDQISDYYYSMISNFTWYLSTIIGAIVLMGVINWHTTLIIVFLTLMQLVIAIQLKTGFKNINKQQKENEKDELFSLNQVIENNDYLKINYDEQKEVTKDVLELFKDEYSLNMKITFLEIVSDNINSIFNIAKQCVVFYFSYILFEGRKIELGDIVALNSYMLWIIPVLQGVHHLIKEKQVNDGNIEIVSQYIEDYHYEDNSNKLTIKKVKVLGEIITPEKILFIKGNSGVGKTTLAEAFFSLNSHYVRRILINNQYVENYSKLELLKSMIICPQHPMILDKSIKENIVLENSTISDKEIFILLKKVQLNFSDIEDKKTEKLSYGEKKRLMILRTLLIDREVYIFDEPTAGLDQENKYIVLNLIDNYLKDKIVIIITHDNLEKVKFKYDTLYINNESVLNDRKVDNK